jgi:Ser/Thr protein kinase RdoA (MazF antagonist)
VTIEPGRLAELTDVLAAQGWEASSLDVLSPPAPAKRNRALYRAVLRDGTVVKLRVMEDAAAAAELAAHRSTVGPAFARVLAVRGAVIVEAWIDGDLATDLDPSAARAAEAGAVLGELHRHPVGSPTASTVWLDPARADVATLRSEGSITGDEATAIEQHLSAGDPGTYVPSLIHRDFCAENFVVDAGGVLRVIDNEWFCLGPAGFDVGRTRNRWPMTDAERGAFDAGYREAAGSIADEAFWCLVADLFGARVEHIWVTTAERPILERVRTWAAGGEW